MTCSSCKEIIDSPDLPHVVRKCPDCGRVMQVRDSSIKDGIKVKEGDKFVLPAGWMQLSFNPLKSKGQFTKRGIQVFAEMLFFDNLPSKYKGIEKELRQISEKNKGFLQDSEILHGIDFNNIESFDLLIKKLESNRDTLEWWAYLTLGFGEAINEAKRTNNINLAIWATACMERCRSMFIFKQEFEEAVWIGQSARRLIDLLRIWDIEKNNDDESFWQQLFSSHQYALSQLFAVPITFIQDKAYLGGTSIDRGDSRFVDYLFSAESSKEAVLIEIKTPVKSLLNKRPYRKNAYSPSQDLSGSVVQVIDYKSTLMNDLKIRHPSFPQVSIFNPRCVVIIGNAQNELDSEAKRRSFEFFRASLKDIEIVTYDELFRKLDILAELFSIVRRKT